MKTIDEKEKKLEEVLNELKNLEFNKSSKFKFKGNYFRFRSAKKSIRN